MPSVTAGGPRGWLSNRSPTNVYAPKVISGKSKYIPQIMMLMDFVCDVENVINMSYGEKGADWDIIDGKYRWVAPEIKTPYNPTGTMSYTEYFNKKYPNVYMGEANMSVINDAQVSYDMSDAFADPDYKQFLEEAAMYVKDGSTLTKPQPITRFDAADSEEQAQLKTILDTYASEITIKIIMGQLPISEFDNMKAKLKELGSDKLVEMYRKAAE
jgi:putative aldouronate transport system substrate-binding protein